MQHCRSSKTKQQDDTRISKNSGYVAGASKITYTLLWQFLNTNKFKRNIYYLLLYSNTFQDSFKIGRTLPQLHKNYETFYRSNSRWLDASFDTEKSRLQVCCYKNSSQLISGACTKIIPKGLYSQYFNAYMEQKIQKTTLPVCCKLLAIFFFFFLHRRTPSTS